MAAPRALLSLTVCLLLGHQTFAKNDAPCQLSKRRSGYQTFLQRHLPPGTPSSLDRSDWGKYLKTSGACKRPTQSFLHPQDQDRVISVCSNRGGRVYKDNLCISKEPFKFVTVRSEPDTCGIRSIQEESKHLILACEVLDNQCLPVHFEGNPGDLKPEYNAKGCQDPEGRGHAPSVKGTWLWLLFGLLIIIYFY